MTALWDFSELRESAALFAGLLARRGGTETTGIDHPTVEPASPVADVAQEVQAVAAVPTNAQPTPEPPVRPRLAPPLPAPPTLDERRTTPRRFREDQLSDVIAEMCRRAGFAGTVVTDGDGLPLALHNSPVRNDVIGAFTTVLGGALERAGRLLDTTGISTIALDIGLTDKAVLRRFSIDGRTYYLLVLCGQDVDARSEIELSVDELTTLLSSGATGGAP